MSRSEIISEIPKLSHEARREIMRRIIEIEDEAVVLKDCDQRALERFQMLDQMEAEGLIHTGQRSFGFAVESAQLNAELTSATEAASQRR